MSDHRIASGRPPRRWDDLLAVLVTLVGRALDIFIVAVLIALAMQVVRAI